VEKVIPVVLKNEFGNEVYTETEFIDHILDMKLTELTTQQKKERNIDYGVTISKINNSEFKKFGIEEGAIILAIDRQKVNQVSEIEKYLRASANNQYITLQILNINNHIEFISIGL
jgi:C-terminal processing protease CtpA/Prc